ncbi:MAG: DUF2919 family protein [Proteobacteria bacterium]|nr:MAG: DUF2919 family protein [Pseudomonadota bacterium]
MARADTIRQPASVVDRSRRKRRFRRWPRCTASKFDLESETCPVYERRSPPLPALPAIRQSSERTTLNSKQRNDFDLNDFDRRGQLKTPVLLIASLAFLSRYPLVLVLSAFSTLMLKRRGVDFGGIGLPPLEGLATSVPAIALLLVVLFREKLTSRAWSRALLRFGVPIGFVIALAQFLLDLRVFMANGHRTSVWIVMEGIMVLYVAVYFLRSRKASNYFRTYGAPQDS